MFCALGSAILGDTVVIGTCHDGDCGDTSGSPHVLNTCVFLSPDRLAFSQEFERPAPGSESWLAINNFRRVMSRPVKRAARKVRSLADGQEKAAVTPRDLRKTAIPDWSKGDNSQTHRAMAGHSDIQTTMRYYASTTGNRFARVR